MCIFTGTIEHVSGTEIFARRVAPGEQGLVYSLELAVEDPLAMVLPLPVPAGPAEDAVRFVDLEGYPAFFHDLSRAFDPIRLATRGAPKSSQAARETLKVHDVGRFEASFVPTLADFDRLDPRFRLDGTVWDALPLYRDWGFAVFELKTEGKRSWLRRLLGAAPKPMTVHPMAFVFPTRDPDRLFFPTVHVHDGHVHDSAHFDHSLYCQLAGLGEAGPITQNGWTASSGPLGDFIRSGTARGVIGDLVDVSHHAHRLVLDGILPNEDTWVA